MPVITKGTSEAGPFASPFVGMIAGGASSSELSLRLTAALIMVFAMAASGWAQRGAVGRAPMSPVRAAPAVRMAPTANARVGTPLQPNFAPIRGVPGVGFDFQHLAAVSPTVHDRFGQEHRYFVTPIHGPIFGVIIAGLPYYASFDTGVPYYYSDSLQQDSQPDSQQPSSLASPLVPSPVPVDVSSPAERTADDQPAAVSQAATPVPEIEQLVLVRRDGQLLFAVAFTTSGDRLIYITPEGMRRSFPLAELDKEATRQMNDVNGTTITLPN